MLRDAARRVLFLVWFSAGTVAVAVAQSSSAPAAAAEYSREQLIKMSAEVQKDVAEIRGWPFKQPVKTDVYSEAELRRFIEKRLFEEQFGGGRLEQTEAMLRMVGLIPRDCDLRKTVMDVLLNQIGGFYDPPSRSFYMLQRAGVMYGELLNRVLVAHELCHALDDQYLDLQKLMEGSDRTEDQELVLGAVLEGSATQLMTVYMGKAMASGAFDTAELSRVIQDEMARSRVFEQAPRYFTALMANYICGMYLVVNNDLMLLQASDEAAGRKMQANMLRLTRHLPSSSEQVLHPEKYWDAGQRDEPVRVDDAGVLRLIQSAERSVVHRNTFGELNCALLATDPAQPFSIMTASMPSAWTNDAATGWGGDRFYLLAEGGDEKEAARGLKGLRGVWITTWDTPDDRDEFVSDYEMMRPDAQRTKVLLGAQAAVFLYGFDEAQAAALAQALRRSPPQWTKDGKPWSAE